MGTGIDLSGWNADILSYLRKMVKKRGLTGTVYCKQRVSFWERMCAMKRDSSVELARLLACLGVIGIHTALSPNLGGVYEWDKIFLGCLSTDAVGVFWMITGCFFFRRTDYRRTWISTLKKIMLPVMLYSLFIFYFADWAFGEKTLMESLSHPVSDYVNVVRSLLTLSHPTADGGHFWYVYVYLLLVLVSLIVNKVKKV